jgi:hypothetical protein
VALHGLLMVERKRDKPLNVRLLEAEMAMLSELAERDGVTVSEWIRNVIRRDHLLAFSTKPRPKPKGK